MTTINFDNINFSLSENGEPMIVSVFFDENDNHEKVTKTFNMIDLFENCLINYGDCFDDNNDAKAIFINKLNLFKDHMEKTISVINGYLSKQHIIQ